jgi:hypothetical protein
MCRHCVRHSHTGGGVAFRATVPGEDSGRPTSLLGGKASQPLSMREGERFPCASSTCDPEHANRYRIDPLKGSASCSAPEQAEKGFSPLLPCPLGKPGGHRAASQSSVAWTRRSVTARSPKCLPRPEAILYSSEVQRTCMPPGAVFPTDRCVLSIRWLKRRDAEWNCTGRLAGNY